MSALTILGWAFTIIGGLGVAAVIVVIVLAGIYDLQQKRATKKQRPDGYEASAYGPARDQTNRLCELRGHNYYLNDVGTYWVCTRGDDKVARIIPMDDLATIESYANGEIA